MLSECETLVSLDIDLTGSDGYAIIHGLKLTPRLRVLSLCHSDIADMRECLLTDENITTLRGLRSLKCREAIPSSQEYLGRITSLVHLDVQLSPSSIPSFTSAFAHLQLLRAVELRSDDFRGESSLLRDWNEALCALASACRNLEHLALEQWILPTPISPNLLSRFARLVSINMHDWDRSENDADWGWLVALTERGQLEHLVVTEPRMPFDLVCRVVEGCKVYFTSCYLTHSV